MLSGAESAAAPPHPPLIGTPRPCCADSRAKRMLDIVLSAVLLIALLPLMLVIGLAVAMSSTGPVVFRQTRIGLGERPFTMLKFRTMRHDSSVGLAELLVSQNIEPSICAKPRHDPRITAVGRFIRRTSLDELPQLVNVLRGQMSLVGPRPNIPEEVALLSPQQRRRLSAKPGMTGLWQVSGRSALTVDEAVRLDLQYVDQWRLRLDLLVLLRTLPAVLRTSDAR
ncbi:hypothetical protein AQI88_25195 [Streptomyces cellostaticus]|uniref:Bacterial sugar transferase domain-containing protein n=1 Tax=Streptomyces cellostaticus TaxID=67285 RepID=A0A117PV40_9ACTN|nr:sugar transferase [Streptomyces cellostaticus]KUM93708.1 hypothetical protein AQI88_25195 [Streptomyces cellostaticus]GHI07613.1 hypothetical protein Scel_59340 [Streptomyces cellostaticus]